ncbi:breast cancer type 1 susceptibility protein homolog isoform X2 [Scyliorhinus canicula]|uniref:breast cancer type 1 susceptibility protein homolog isoform X2 n=1 Tax=Scyliorhinus canicula TaxID=7830 RepID=UPI0018F48616|nr:breast cancer type 1 susceptibility protein homolog isoform X2 [Scyliorhinus canicula]
MNRGREGRKELLKPKWTEMSLCKSEIERVHEVLSLMLKNLECPICLELMKEPISTKCDHQFCRFCILKLFGEKKSTIQCPLCNNTFSKRSLQESTRFKQLAEGIMKVIQAFELDTGYEFSIGNTSKRTPTEINAYRQLWQNDSHDWSNTPQNVMATGISKNRTLTVCSDPPLTEFVQRISSRNKRQKIGSTPVYVGIDSDSSEEPLFKTHVNVKSALHQKPVNKQATSQKEKIGQCDNDEKPCEGKKSKLSKPVLEELFSSEMDDNEVSEDTANTDAGDYSCATESETEQKQMIENISESNFCSPEPPSKIFANESFSQVAAEWVNKKNCIDGNQLFADSAATLLSEKGALEKVVKLANHEELNQEDPTWIVENETDFQRSASQSVPKVSKRKSQRIIKKVSEWLSKINVDEVAALGIESNPHDQNTESDSLAESEETSSSEETEKVKDDLVSPLKEKSVANITATDVKNKIFGKTYKRDKRKSAPVNWSFNSDNKSDDLSIRREDAFDVSCNKTQKGKRKGIGLDPEDFIKRTVNEEDTYDSNVQNGEKQIDPEENVPVVDNIELETNKEIPDEPSDIKQIVVTAPTTVAVCHDVMEESEQIVQQPDLELCKTDAEMKKKMNKVLGKKGKKSSIKQTRKRTKPLQLVNQLARADASPRSNPVDTNENKIDNFPSSEEPVKAELETRATRRSSRLKLLDEKLILQDKNKGKKSKLTRIHTLPSPGADIEPLAEPHKENTDARMICGETESLPTQDIIAEACNEQFPNDSCSKQDDAASHGSRGNSVVEEPEGSDVPGLSKNMQQQLRDCNKAKTEDDPLHVQCPMCLKHSSVTVASCSHSEDSGSQISLLLLRPVPGEKRDPKVHSGCIGEDEVNPNGATPLVECNSKVGMINSEESSIEGVSITHQKRSKEVNDDSEVDTQLLLKSFKLSKRRSFILMPGPERQTVEDGCAPVPKGTGAVASCKSEKINTGDSGNRDYDGNVAADQEMGKVNLDKAGSPIKTTETANGNVKSKLCTSELNSGLQLLNREDRDSVEIVPPTVSTRGSPLPLVFPQHIQEVVPLSSSRSKGKRNSSLPRRKRSNSKSSLANTEKGIFDSDGSIQATASGHLNSNTNNSSCLKKNPNTAKDRALIITISQEIQQDGSSTRLDSNAHPESELLFSTRDPLGQEANEKDSYQERKSDNLLKEREFYKNSELLQNIPMAVESATESELVKLTNVAQYHSQPNVQESITVGNKTSESKCPRNSQVSSVTPDGLLDSAEGSLNKSRDEVQNKWEMGEGKEQLKQHEVAIEKLRSSSPKSSTPDQVRCPRKRPVKLSTSESETSDDDLPCFQIFGCNRLGSNAASVSQSSLSAMHLSSKGSLAHPFSLPNSNTAVKKTFYAEVNKLDENVNGEGSSKNECLSPSQESGESPDLFSSHSDGSSPDASPQPKVSSKTLKQINATSVTESPNQDEKNGGKVEETWEAPCLQPLCLDVTVPGNDSEASHAGNSSPESDILNTQQRYAIQNNIKKLEHEMAVLVAVLEEHGSQDTERLLSIKHPEDCAEFLENQERTVTAEFPLGQTENLQHRSKSKFLPAAEAARPQPLLNTSVIFAHGDKEEIEYPLSQIPERLQAVNGSLNQFQSKAASQEEMTNSPKKEKIKEHTNSDSEGEELLKDIMSAQKFESTGKRDCVLASANSPSNLTPMIRCQRTEDIADNASMSPPQHDRRAMSKCIKKSRASLTSSPVFNKSSNASKSTVATIQRKMSFVASGLNKNEILLVETFARKTGATFLSNFSPSTTHVIMKTDADLVCERTLKYFMGIAGRRWVVSYQWITECFRKCMVIDEVMFEVQGDVINGRSHNGPRKARKTTDEKLLLSHYEICCFGSFTGMSRDQLEWMVELCGASIIKEPYLFTYSSNRTAVVVVQPDANSANTDYETIQRQYNTVVSREWILDSVACYQNHQLEAYIVCQLH